MGSAILGVPIAFAQGGILVSLFFFPICFFLAWYCIWCLLECKREARCDTLSDLAAHSFGQPGRYIAGALLIALQIGCGVSYVLYIGFALASLFPSVYYPLFVFLIIGLLCAQSQIRTLRLIAPFVLIANVCLFVGLLTYLGYCISQFKSGQKLYLINVRMFPTVFGMIVFAVEGVGMVLPIEGRMKRPRHFMKLLTTALCTICLLCCVFGVCAYIAFGPHTARLMTDNLPWKSFIHVFDVMMLCVALFVTFQLNLYPVFEACENLESVRQPPGAWFHVKSTAFRLSVVITTAIFAIAIPDFADFVALVGGTAGIYTAFVLPCALHLKQKRRRTHIARVILHWCIIVVSLLISVLVVVLTAINLARRGRPKPK